MCKDNTKKTNVQENTLFSLPEMVSDKKIRIDFNSPDVSSNGGLMLIGSSKSPPYHRISQNQVFLQIPVSHTLQTNLRLV